MTVSFNEIFSEEIKSLKARRSQQGCAEIPVDVEGDRLPSTRLGLTGLSLSGGGVRSASFCLGVLQAINGQVGLKCLDYLSTVSGGGYIGATTTIGMSVTGQFPFGLTGADPGETAVTQHIRDNSRYLVKDGVRSVFSALAIYLRGIMMNVLIMLPLMLVLAAVLIVSTIGCLSLLQWAAGSGGILSRMAQQPLLLSIVIGSLLALGLAVYAGFVSVVKIAKLSKRQRWAWRAGVLIMACGAVSVLFDLHPALLQYMLAPVAPPRPSGTGQKLQVMSSLVAFANRFGILLAPVVAVLVPYLKPIIAKAASSGDRWGDLVARIGSRAVLLLIAALVPLLLWAWTLQLAYWGLYAAACSWPRPIPPATADLFGAVVACTADAAAPGLLASLFSGASGAGWSGPVTWYGPALSYSAGAFLVWLTWQKLNVNANSLHQLYRDRLGTAFLVAEYGSKGSQIKNYDDFKLSQINERTAPYHLINSALNVPGSKEANQRGRNADFFIFSKLFIGSPLTGYVRTDTVERVTDRLDLGTAMAISGAAAAPNMGMISMRPLSPTIALLNVRLGRWVRHPAAIEKDAEALGKDTDSKQDADTIARDAEALQDKSDALGVIKEAVENPAETPEMNASRRRAAWPGPRYFLREAVSKSGRHLSSTSFEGMDEERVVGESPNSLVPEPRNGSDFVFLTDGGHIENLGVYELLRRRCRLIVAVDAEADPEGRFFALEQLQRFARIDLGTKIVIDVRPIADVSAAVTASAQAKKFPQRKAGPHVAVGFIDYPPKEGTAGPREQGILVYVKASMSGDENDYVMGYKMRNPVFPQETTADQFFSEEQLEVYRALGEHVMRRFLTGQDIFACHEDNRRALQAALDKLLPGAAPA